MKFLLELDLLDALNDAALKLQTAERALERVKSFPQPKDMVPEIWERQLALVTADHSMAETRLARAQEAVEEETLVVELQAIASKRYFDLAAEHPPTEEQVAKADEMAELAGAFEGLTEAQRRRMQIDFNPDTFPRALVGACALDLDEDELDAFYDEMGAWTQDDRAELFNNALAVCQRASILKR